MYGKKAKGHVLLGIGEQESEIQNAPPSVINVIKVRRQKDICMGISQTNMCSFSYWRAREGNSECTVKFIKVRRQKKK